MFVLHNRNRWIHYKCILSFEFWICKCVCARACMTSKLATKLLTIDIDITSFRYAVYVKNAVAALISKIHRLISINNRFQMFFAIHSRRILWHGHKTLVTKVTWIWIGDSGDTRTATNTHSNAHLVVYKQRTTQIYIFRCWHKSFGFHFP